MTPLPATRRSADDTALPTRMMLIVLLAGASLAFSMAFACATPFAALAAVAVWRLKRRDALVAVTLAWFVNQADGYLFMHYPRTWDSFGWGVAIWLAAMAACGASAVGGMTRWVPWAAICNAFVAAFVAYEAMLMAVSVVLPSSPGAFASSVILRLLTLNAMAFALLFVVTGLLNIVGAALLGLARHRARAPARERLT